MKEKRRRFDIFAIITPKKAISLGLKIAFVGLVLLMIFYSKIESMSAYIALFYMFTLYSILVPIALYMIPQSFAYYAYLPAPAFGLLVIITLWLNRYGLVTNLNLWFSILIAFGLLMFFHYWTRKGVVIYYRFLFGGLGIELKTLSREGSMMGAPVILLMGIAFSNTEFMGSFNLNVLFLVSYLIVFYALFSIMGLNVAYRTSELIHKIGIKNLNSRIEKVEERLSQKYPNESDKTEFFSYILRSSTNDFIYGDYERSFIDLYRIINDKIILDPSPLVKKKVNENTLDEYRKIRVFLVHGYLQEKKSRLELPIKVEDVLWAKKMLFQKTLDLIELAFYVADNI